MSVAELATAAQTLPRADKLRLVQLLVADLAQEEGVPLVEAGTPYPVWTPYHAHDAATVLLQALDGS